MSKIATRTETKNIINKYGFSFQKRLGQNFLIDGNIIDIIIQGAEITSGDTVLEIGPGIGSLTQGLAQVAKKVIGIEIDKKLIPMLEETMSEEENVQIIQGDILKFDIPLLLQKEGIKEIKVVANLPYYITTPIVMQLLETDIAVESITVMVQKEVADRMNAIPGTKSYGSLSLATRYYSNTEIITQVPAESFIPRPKVGSTVIKLTKKKKEEIEKVDSKLLFKIIKGAFAQRRKTLINSLTNSQMTIYTKEDIIRALEKLDLDLRIRGEALDLKAFVKLTKVLSENGKQIDR